MDWWTYEAVNRIISLSSAFEAGSESRKPITSCFLWTIGSWFNLYSKKKSRWNFKKIEKMLTFSTKKGKRRIYSRRWYFLSWGISWLENILTQCQIWSDPASNSIKQSQQYFNPLKKIKLLFSSLICFYLMGMDPNSS